MPKSIYSQKTSGNDAKLETLDGTLDLADAIQALKVLAGIKDTGFDKDADVNGNGRIGLAEVFYIIQGLAGVRPMPSAENSNPLTLP